MQVGQACLCKRNYELIPEDGEKSKNREEEHVQRSWVGESLLS